MVTLSFLYLTFTCSWNVLKMCQSFFFSIFPDFPLCNGLYQLQTDLNVAVSLIRQASVVSLLAIVAAAFYLGTVSCIREFISKYIVVDHLGDEYAAR